MLRFIALLAAVGGAALAYFADPSAGRRRRHQARDRTASLARRGGRRARRLGRHLSSDAAGLARRLAHARPGRPEPDLDDATLAHKVESILFRDRDVPKGQINVNAERGVVFLRGQVERPELVEKLGERVLRVKGVRGVENRLRVPPDAAA